MPKGCHQIKPRIPCCRYGRTQILIVGTHWGPEKSLVDHTDIFANPHTTFFRQDTKEKTAENHWLFLAQPLGVRLTIYTPHLSKWGPAVPTHLAIFEPPLPNVSIWECRVAPAINEMSLWAEYPATPRVIGIGSEYVGALGSKKDEKKTKQKTTTTKIIWLILGETAVQCSAASCQNSLDQEHVPRQHKHQ